MGEKREYTRFRIHQLVACTPDGDQFYRAEGIDISKGGLRCRAATAVEPMTSVFVLLTLPYEGGEREVRCEGYVSHSAKVEGVCEFGVRFASIEAEDRRVLDAYLESLVGSPEA